MAALADDSQKWRDAEAEILQRLDLTSEYLELGVRITNSTPTAKGWLQCHSIDREDSSASAGVNVGDGPQRGLYRDHGGTKPAAVNFFTLAAQLKGMERKEVRKYYATKAGVKLPASEDKYWREKFSTSPLTVGLALLYSRGKGGVEAQSLFDLGGQAAVWPLKIPPEKANHMIAFPAYGATGVDAEPCGWHCVSANPTMKIRKWRGPGKPPEEIKTMWLGRAGLLGLHGRDLSAIRRVWFVEGISDLAAIRSWLPVDELAVTTGGCNTYIDPEIAAWFAGKDCCVVYDVGDKDDQGQIHAAVMCGRLLPFAASTRKVVLPKAATGKNDLRSWKIDGGTFEQLCKLADETLSVQPESKDATTTAENAILKDLGCVVVGQHRDGKSIDVYGLATKRISTIKDLNRFTVLDAIIALGREVQDKITDKKEAPPGVIAIDDLRRAIAIDASEIIMADLKPAGAGIWPAGDDKLLIVGRGESWIFDPHTGSWAEQETATVGQLRMHFADTSWYDTRTLGHYCRLAHDIEWCRGVWTELEALFGQWGNWQHKTNATIAAAMSLASWVQTCWSFRPMIGVIGPTNSGKTTLVQRTLPAFFGGLGLYCLKPSAAGIRQTLNPTAKIPIIDELESDARHREDVLKMLRASTGGGAILRGSSNQEAKSSSLAHIAWLACINLNLFDAADRNRYLMLELKEVKRGTRGGLKIVPKEIADLGMKALAVALRRFHIWHRTFNDMKATQLAAHEMEGVDGRLVELHMLPLTIAADLAGWSPTDTQERLSEWIEERNFKADTESDEEALIRSIYSATVRLPRGEVTTVGQLLSVEMVESGGRAVNRSEILGPIGISFAADGVFFSSGGVSRLLQDTTWRAANTAQYLRRLPGASKMTSRPAGTLVRGVLVPYQVLSQITGTEHDGAQPRF